MEKRSGVVSMALLLSIGLMVKNESKYLEQCLRSLTPVLKEISSELVIVDTGSTDSTVEIARRYTDKVFHHQWFDDFAGMRNILLKHTSGEWFFYLDGDEVVEDASGIIRFFKSKRHKKYNAAFIEMRNPYTSKDSDAYGVFQALRFFVNDEEFHFKGIVHEQPQAKGPVAKVDGYIVHYGYVSDDKELMEYKFERNVALINKVLEKEPDNIYHLFQLSQSHAMYGRPKEALEPIEKAYELAKSKGLSNHMNVVTQLANVRFKNGMFRECEAICQEGLALKDGYVDLYYFQAMSQVELGKYEDAIRNFRRYLSLVEDYERGRVVVDLSLSHHTLRSAEHVYLVLCAVHKKRDELDLAAKYGEKIRDRALAKDAIRNLVGIYFKKEEYAKLRDLYEVWSHDESATKFLIDTIEDRRLQCSREAKKELSFLFGDEASPYGMLNLVRAHIYEPEFAVEDRVWQRLDGLDLAKKPDYYADLIWGRLQCGRPVAGKLSRLRNDKVFRLFSYLVHVHDAFLDVLKSALSSRESSLFAHLDSDEVCRIKTAVLRAVLVSGKDMDDQEYMRWFKMYVDAGVRHLETCYRSEILDRGVSWAKTAADGFLFVMRKIRDIDRCTVEYVRGLREALAQDQSMKRGIDLLLKDVQDELLKPEQDELEILKESVRTAIQECIDTGELDTAVMLINEYEDIVGIDGPLCAAKGIVHIINGEVGKAEDIFLTGIGIEPENPDLLYNLGYLKEISGSKREAFGYYSRAFEVVTDEEFREELVQALGRVSPKSPVHQNGDGRRLMEEQASTLKELLRGKGY